jgi:transcriptional regulator with XRE-family HTH domain
MDINNDKRFGENLRRVRMEKGLTQEQLAARLQTSGVDITRSTLAKIEAGQRHTYLDELICLQKVLAVPYEDLLE